jgi:hypothetical protein
MNSNFQNGGDIKSVKKQSRRAAILYFLNCLLTPFALLYVPSVLTGFGYVMSSSVFLFLPASAQSFGQLAQILGIGELAFFWLLIWGAKPQPWATVTGETK